MKVLVNHNLSRKKKGLALAAAVSLLSILGVLFIALLGGSVEQKKWTDETQLDARVRAVADTVIALSANQIWSGFEVAYGPDDLQPWNFKTHMDGFGVPDQSTAGNPTATDFIPLLGLAPDGDGNFPIGGGFVTTLDVLRMDEWDSSRITITARVRMSPSLQAGEDNNQATVQQTFDVNRPDWEGLDYALLANNVNCILCHASIDDAERFYNQDPGERGNFDRVKVGSLESIHIRSNPDSQIAGTLYLAGNALEEDGDKISNWSGLSLKSAGFDNRARLIEDGFGNLTAEDLSPADALAPLANENLYLDYLDNGTAGQVDGALPDYFPSPFPDNGGFDLATGLATPGYADNRILDANEFLATAGSATGTISGGSVGVVPVGSQLTTLGMFDTALSSGSSNLGSLTSGNVILNGTALNPIILDGTVAIEGDVVLTGYIQGRGSIMASGNVFIPGELKYLDGTDGSGNRTYGSASDGSVNAVALTAGGNITTGDPSHPPSGGGLPVDGTPATSFNFIMDELAIFNRGEWIKTQTQLPGEAVYQKTGENTTMVSNQPMKDENYLDPVDIYENQPTGNMIAQNNYGWVNYGNKMVDVYITVNHPADPPAPYGSPWSEQVYNGQNSVPDNRWEVVSTTMVAETASVYVRTDNVPRVRQVPDGPAILTPVTTDIMEWVTPMHPNPFYEGVGYIPRYYSYSENTPVPVFNLEGFFDPTAEIWHSPERAEDWGTGRLTLADPTDSTDPMLYDGSGNPIAVIQTVSPSADWLTGDVLADIVDRELSSRSASDPVEIDATLYSGNAIFGMVPGRGQPGVDGKMLVNGGLVAADIGVLAPKGIQINYDRRSREVLEIADDRKLSMRKSLFAPAPRP